VADTGVGIAPEHLPHLFERFYRVDKARARVEGGAGLGLAISHWLARAHGGEITVESRPGRGTTFTVRMPRQCANQTGTRSAWVVARGEERVQVVHRL
jgi:signal transduction histidine kinase